MVVLSMATCEVLASEPSTAGETAMEERIRTLEAQLDRANQTIADLESQLEAAGVKETTVTQSPETQVVVYPSSAGGSAEAEAIPPAGSSQKAAAVAVAEPAPSGPSSPISPFNEREIARMGQDVPASVTYLGPETLMLGGVEDVSRLEFLAPGLRYGQTGHDIRMAMRGARSNSIGPEADPVVGYYEDGVYIATSTEGLNSFLDVERVDVLRGPQNTNFGHMAYAGAVSIVSNKPTFDGIDGYAEAENGLPDKTRWRMALNLPASDTLAFRVAGLSESRSGWINNHYIESDSDDLNDRKVQTIRGSVLWQPTDRLSVLFWSRYQDENGTGSAPWGYQQVGAYVNGILEPGNQFAPPGAAIDGGPWDVNRNYISAAQYENWVNTLDLNWDMGFASLQWLFNFTAFHGQQIYDNDYTDQYLPRTSAFIGWETSQTGWSNELRMTSNPGGSLNWLVGAYWSDRKAEWGWLESLEGDQFQPAWDVHGTYSTDTQAVFGQLTYDFNDRFSVTGGLRWNDEGKTMKTGQKGSWDDVLWKAAGEYRFSEDMMSYLSISTGYRAGGINTAPGVNPTWEPEKLTAYEWGLKSVLASGKLMTNLALWYNDFKDVQSQSFLVLPYPGSPEATEYTGNGGPMDAKGIEAEIQWSPMPQWNISTQIAYTKSKFGNYTTASLAGLGDIPGHTDGDQLSYNGWRPALSPEWVVGFQTSYSFDLKNAGTFTPYFQTTYASDYYINDINLAGTRQASHTRTDLRFIWLAPRGNFQLQFYYLNAEDEAVMNWARVYSPAARPDITTVQANWGNPNTYGIIFDYKF
jgi:outer membrane receptor protein involved in Fe transport